MKKSHMRGIAAVFVGAAVIIIAAIIAAVPSCSNSIDFGAKYFFVCYKSVYDAHSASSISSTIQSYGGAGYIVKVGEAYYVTVACYYNEEDAQTVCHSLNSDGLSCQVVEADIDGYDISSSLSDNKDAILGALNSLNQLGSILYQTANAIDSGTLSGTAVQSILADARITLKGLLSANAGNALYGEISYLIALVDDIDSAYVYAREMRALQIAICDTILNVNFC